MLGRRRGVLWLGLLALAGAGAQEDAATAPPAVAPEVELDAPAEPSPPPPVEELPPLPADMIVPKLSFSNPFNQYDNGVIPGWQYGGEATLANDYISLTPAAPNKVGWVWSDEPVSMAAWEVQLEFHIGGQANRGAGGGMAFWFSAQQGRTGPIYGHEDNYEGLGVFFDTYEGDESEETEPFVVAMMNYGTAIGGESESPNYYNNQVGVCFAAYRNLPHLVRARIVWAEQRLQLWLDLDNSGHYQSCVQTKPGDERLKVPESGYFGVTGSTGSFGDSHVVYSFTLANLEGAAAATFGATPYRGSDGSVPAEHVVHQEGRHHETHVRVATHPAQLDTQVGQMGPGNHAAEQVAHATPVPPVQSGLDYMARFSTELRGVEAALIDLKAQLRQDGKLGGSAASAVSPDKSGAVAMQVALSKQLQEMEGRIAAAVTAPAAAVAGGVDAPLAAKLSALADSGGGCGGMQAGVVELQQGVGELHLEVKRAAEGGAEKAAQSGRAVEAAVGRLESTMATLKLRMATLETNQKEDAVGRKALQAQLSSLLQLSGEIKQAQAASSSGGWLMPTLVCGQMLALAAFLFYRMVAKDKKRDHFL